MGKFRDIVRYTLHAILYLLNDFTFDQKQSPPSQVYSQCWESIVAVRWVHHTRAGNIEQPRQMK